MPNLEIHYTGTGWAGLYVNGRLERVGDAYVAEEKAFEILGVKVVESDDFMLGQGTAAGAARTLGEIGDWRLAQTSKLKEAERMRAEALRLTKAAQALEDEAMGKTTKEEKT